MHFGACEMLPHQDGCGLNDSDYFLLVVFGIFCINWLFTFSPENARFLCLVRVGLGRVELEN